MQKEQEDFTWDLHVLCVNTWVADSYWQCVQSPHVCTRHFVFSLGMWGWVCSLRVAMYFLKANWSLFSCLPYSHCIVYSSLLELVEQPAWGLTPGSTCLQAPSLTLWERRSAQVKGGVWQVLPSSIGSCDRWLWEPSFLKEEGRWGSDIRTVAKVALHELRQAGTNLAPAGSYHPSYQSEIQKHHTIRTTLDQPT